MSISSAMQAGVSGLISNSTALASISDNIANSNATGFKRTRTDFTTLVQNTIGDNLYSAGGVTTSNRQLVRQQGLLQTSNSETDLGISGQGMFVVKSKPDATTGTSEVLFSRVGSFTPDANGNFKNQAGFYLQGWPVAADGTVASSPSDLSKLQTVNTANIGGTAEVTTKAGITGNLNASQPISAAATLAIPSVTYDPANAALNMASGAVKPDVQWQFQSYDSRGGLKTFNVSLLKTNVANQWATEISVVPATSINNTGSGMVSGQVRTGTLAFTSDGKLDLTAASNTALLAPLVLNAETAAAAPGQARWAVGTGITGQSVTLDLGQTTVGGGISQFDSPSVQVASTSNGSSFADLASISIDKDGFVTANLSNGVSRKVYQIPLATFANADGLKSDSGGVFRLASDSGTYTLKGAGTGGAGKIDSQSLEASNVDLSTEFTGLITTQRAYSASAKIVTTADEMLSELIQIKR